MSNARLFSARLLCAAAFSSVVHIQELQIVVILHIGKILRVRICLCSSVQRTSIIRRVSMRKHVRFSLSRPIMRVCG